MDLDIYFVEFIRKYVIVKRTEGIMAEWDELRETVVDLRGEFGTKDEHFRKLIATFR